LAFRGTEVETWGSFWDRAGMAMGKKALWRPVRRFPHCPTVMLHGDEPHGWKIDGKTHPEFPLERIAHCRCARSRIAAAPQCERSDLWEKPRTSALYLCRSLSQHLKTTTRKLLSGVPTPNARLFCGRNPFPACSPHRRSVLCKKFILLLLFPLQPSRKTRGGVLDFLIITFISIFSGSGQRAFRSVLISKPSPLPICARKRSASPTAAPAAKGVPSPQNSHVLELRQAMVATSTPIVGTA